MYSVALLYLITSNKMRCNAEKGQIYTNVGAETFGTISNYISCIYVDSLKSPIHVHIEHECASSCYKENCFIWGITENQCHLCFGNQCQKPNLCIPGTSLTYTTTWYMKGKLTNNTSKHCIKNMIGYKKNKKQEYTNKQIIVTRDN